MKLYLLSVWAVLTLAACSIAVQSTAAQPTAARPWVIAPHLLAAVPAPPAASALTIYAGAFTNGWNCLGTAQFSINNSSPALSSHSISITAQNGQTFYLYHVVQSVTSYDSLSFWAYGGQAGGQKFSVVAVSGSSGASQSPVAVGPLMANVWQQIIIPLKTLGANSITDLQGFQIQNTSGNTVPVFYLDKIVLTPPVVTPPSAPAAPTGLTATPRWVSAASIALAWNAVSGATSYTVYRGGTKVQTGLTTPTWTDTTVTSGTAYTYTVTGTGPGGESQPSAAAIATAPNPSALAAPTGLTATPQWTTSCPVCGSMAMAHIVLAWNAVAGATSYTVYRGGTPVQTGLTTPTWTDMSVTSGTVYTYTVTATGVDGESQPSAAATAVAPAAPTPMTGMLTAPTNLCVRGILLSGSCTDVLSWTPVSGAAHYNIYQYSTLIASVSATAGPTYTVPLALYNSSLTYTVTAVDASGMESLPSQLAGPQLTFDAASLPSWASKAAPSVPTNVSATPEWNNGSPRVLVVWKGSGAAGTYNVYRDGIAVAHGLWDLYYLDAAVQPGETHTYAVSAANNVGPLPLESVRTSAVTATVLSAVPAPLGIKVQITKVVVNDDSAVIFFQEIPGVREYRVYDVLNPTKIKYAGVRVYGPQNLSGYIPEPLAIEWNGLDPVNGSNLVVEAVDKLGPFQIMDGMAGPGAMQMNGATRQAINGQGDPSNLPNVLASSDVFHVICAKRVLTGSQVFFDNFEVEKPFTALPLPAPQPNGQFYGMPGSYMEIGNDKWIVKHFGTDLVNSKVFVMGSHLMDTEFDGGGPGSPFPAHNNNASIVFQPKATADISGGKVLHVTFEVDAHFDSRRWCDLFVGPANDTLLHPGKFDEGDGGNNIATASTQLFRWEIKQGTGITMYNNGVRTDLIQPSNWNDSQTLSRVGWDGTPQINGTTQDLDKRHRFDLYLSQTHYRIIETTADGLYTISRDKDFPAGMSLPFSNCQVYFVHQVYHTGNDRPECIDYGFYDPYWPNYRPYSDERHWDNMGEEVLSAFPN